MSAQIDPAQAGNITKFKISSNLDENSIDLSTGVVDYRYYESVLSNNITATATETFTVHETPKIILKSTSLTQIKGTGMIDIAANSCLKIYGSIIRGVTDACAKKDSKTGGQRLQKENNQV